MKLYNYWRSSCSWRIRIALAWKGLDYAYVPVDLRRGRQEEPGYRALNAMGQVPLLVLDDGRALSQSMAIVEYLEERYPEPPLLPGDAWGRARARQLAEAINAGVQPLQNTWTTRGVAALGADPRDWSRAAIERGLGALEAQLDPNEGPLLMGAAVTVADVFLVPQLYNARRFGCEVDGWTRLLAAEAACMSLPAFADTRPEVQPDAA